MAEQEFMGNLCALEVLPQKRGKDRNCPTSGAVVPHWKLSYHLPRRRFGQNVVLNTTRAQDQSKHNLEKAFIEFVCDLQYEIREYGKSV